MKKINLKGRLDLNKQTVSRLNDNEQVNFIGGKALKTFVKTCDHSNMTIRHTLSCHCDSQLTAMDTLTCHCDEKTKTDGC